jgi:hypothetical protein
VIRVALFLLGLPSSVLLALVFALAFLLVLFLLLIAFVPGMSDKVAAIIKVLRESNKEERKY